MLSGRGFLLSGVGVVVAMALAIAQSALHLGTAAWRPLLDNVATFLGLAALAGALNLAFAWWVRSNLQRVQAKHPDADVWPIVATWRMRRALRNAGVTLPPFLGWGFVGADAEGFFVCTRDSAVLLGVRWSNVLDIEATTVMAPMLTPIQSIVVTFRRRGWRIHLPMGLASVGVGGVRARQWERADDVLERWPELRESHDVTPG